MFFSAVRLQPFREVQSYKGDIMKKIIMIVAIATIFLFSGCSHNQSNIHIVGNNNNVTVHQVASRPYLGTLYYPNGYHYYNNYGYYRRHVSGYYRGYYRNHHRRHYHH